MIFCTAAENSLRFEADGRHVPQTNPTRPDENFRKAPSVLETNDPFRFRRFVRGLFGRRVLRTPHIRYETVGTEFPGQHRRSDPSAGQRSVPGTLGRQAAPVPLLLRRSVQEQAGGVETLRKEPFRGFGGGFCARRPEAKVREQEVQEELEFGQRESGEASFEGVLQEEFERRQSAVCSGNDAA